MKVRLTKKAIENLRARGMKKTHSPILDAVLEPGKVLDVPAKQGCAVILAELCEAADDESRKQYEVLMQLTDKKALEAQKSKDAKSDKEAKG